MRAVHAIITGQVQGVGYRWSCLQRADELGVAGWVRNRDDGCVELWAEGADAAVEQLLEWARRGPRWARVDEVLPRPVAAKGHQDFAVR